MFDDLGVEPTAVVVCVKKAPLVFDAYDRTYKECTPGDMILMVEDQSINIPRSDMYHIPSDVAHHFIKRLI